MTATIEDVRARIVPRVTADGRPFTEILHTWREAGVARFALSRVWWTLSDTYFNRASMAAEFIKRRAA
jgi:hypothetical protein